jgi:glutathione S-transferase
VPSLVLDDGTLLNENAAVLLWLADRKPDARLAPAAGTPERYALVNALAFVASEMHAPLGVLFAPIESDEARPMMQASEDFFVACRRTLRLTHARTHAHAQVKSFLKARAEKKLSTLNDVMLKEGAPFLCGDAFSCADAYAYIVLSWLDFLGLGPLDKWARAKAFYDRVAALPNVKAAHARMAENPSKILG